MQVELLVQPPADSPHPPDLAGAVWVLEQHGGGVKLGAALASLPPSAPLHLLAGYLTSSLQTGLAARHSAQLLRALHHSAHLQVRFFSICSLPSKKINHFGFGGI